MKLPLRDSFEWLCGFIGTLKSGLDLISGAVDAKLDRSVTDGAIDAVRNKFVITLNDADFIQTFDGNIITFENSAPFMEFTAICVAICDTHTLNPFGWTNVSLTVNGEEYSYDWAESIGPVYGAWLNLITGEFTVTHGYIESYDGETLPGSWLSDRDEFEEGATPRTGAKVIYELPLSQWMTYQFEPVQIVTVRGENTLSCYCDLYVECRNTVSYALDKLEEKLLEISENAEKARRTAEDTEYYVKSTFAALDRAVDACYEKIRGKLILINGDYQDYSVYVDKVLAGQTVYLTRVCRTADAEEEVQIEEAVRTREVLSDGSIAVPPPLRAGYNLITVSRSDPTGENLPPPDVIPCSVRYGRNSAAVTASDWADFLTECGFSVEYVAVDSPTDFTEDSYFIRCHTDNTLIWPDLNTEDGDYYLRIYHAPEDENTQIYTWSLVRVT